MDYQITPLSPYFKIEIVPTALESALTEEVKKRIEQQWEKESHIRSIFNGKIFNILSFKPDHLTGHFIEYKTYLAYLRDPTLKEYLPVRPLGVTGITRWKNQFLIGKRVENVTLYPGHYEFAPAGGVDLASVKQNQIDLRKQILVELEEEVGVSEQEVLSVTPWILMHRQAGHYEICLKIELDSQKTFNILPTPEYERCLWIEADQLRPFILTSGHPFVPLTYSLLQQI